MPSTRMNRMYMNRRKLLHPPNLGGASVDHDQGRNFDFVLPRGRGAQNLDADVAVAAADVAAADARLKAVPVVHRNPLCVMAVEHRPRARAPVAARDLGLALSVGERGVLCAHGALPDCTLPPKPRKALTMCS